MGTYYAILNDKDQSWMIADTSDTEKCGDTTELASLSDFVLQLNTLETLE